MEKDDVIAELERQLGAVKAERQAGQRDPQLQAARDALKRYQSARLGATHADLLAAPDSKQAARFFLQELCGASDVSGRDTDIERVLPTMRRVLPLHALQTLTQALLLDALTERLDSVMARALGTDFDEAAYVEAYRTVTTRIDREQQLGLIEALGTSLAQLVNLPFLSVTLGLMRGPARLAGLGNLQRFLEDGFNGFKQVRQPRVFVATIVRRERAALQHIHARRADPFDIAD